MRRERTVKNIIAWRGPSVLTGAPIMVAITGLRMQSRNLKTGTMLQAWILRQDVPPHVAKQQNTDDAVCGDCWMRGKDGKQSACYTVEWHAPNRVWQATKKPNVFTEVLSFEAGAIIINL